MRVVSFNVLAFNTDTDALAEELRHCAGDVVALFEVTDAHLVALEAVLPEHRVLSWPAGAVSGAVVASRFPFASSAVHPGRSIRVELGCDGGPSVTLWAAHPTSPRAQRGGIKAWVYEHEHLREQLAGDASCCLMVVGDLNATPHHRMLRQTLRRGRVGLVRSPLSRGTWRHPVLGWMAALDHIAARGPVEVITTGVGRPAGSDHRPVWADVVIHPC
jgi:endonuclease/exonuclease/phosphatase (EEP) superfamily protein YafD